MRGGDLKRVGLVLTKRRAHQGAAGNRECRGACNGSAAGSTIGEGEGERAGIGIGRAQRAGDPEVHVQMVAKRSRYDELDIRGLRPLDDIGDSYLDRLGVGSAGSV